MKVFLDANVLFSAPNEGSGIARLVTYLKRRGGVITSDYARAEAFRNISIKKPEWRDGLADVLCGMEVVASLDAPVPVEIAEKDRPILAAAIARHATVLLTADQRDFGFLFGRSVGGVLILSPKMLTDLLEDEAKGTNAGEQR